MIVGYNNYGEPLFDNPSEYKEWLESKKLEKYNNRDRFEIAMDAYRICDNMMDIFQSIQFGGFGDNSLKDLAEIKADFDKEFELMVEWRVKSE